MKPHNKTLVLLLVGAMTTVGGAGIAAARHGVMHYGRGSVQHQMASPEMQQMMEKAYNNIAPLQLELRAKQQELTAKIYSGADDKTLRQLTEEVNALYKRVLEARVQMQREFARAGMPMHMGNCPMGGGGMGMGGMGMGMGMRGNCPGMPMGQGFALPDGDGGTGTDN